jgi:hypothetical protein
MSTRIAQSKFTNLFVNHFEKMQQSHIKSMGGYSDFDKRFTTVFMSGALPK